MSRIGNLLSCAAILAASLSAALPADASTYSTAVLLDNPVAYYRLSETTGTLAANSGTGGAVLDGSTATYANPQTLPSTQPQIGQPGPRQSDTIGGMPLVGFEPNNVGVRSTANTGAQMSVPDNALLDITGALTLEAWVKRNATQASTGNTEGILGKFIGSPTGTNERSYALTYINSTNRLQFVVNSNGASTGNVPLGATGTQVPLAANEWVHLAAVYVPSTSMTLYVNGVAATTLTTGVPAALYSGAADLMIGRQFSTASNVAFEGLIDEAAVYNKALTAEQIKAHYDAAFIPEPMTWQLAFVAGTALLFRLRRKG